MQPIVLLSILCRYCEAVYCATAEALERRPDCVFCGSSRTYVKGAA